ncbi:MAG: hypothetical protein QW777_04870 [Candidatus Caldarchaeum sp.]
MLKLVRMTALAPPVLISLMSYTKFDFSNYYVAVGIVSLLLISSTEKVKWAAVGLVYIPAIYTVGLLLTGSAAPFLGLAAGYILASPLVISISTYSSRSPSGILSGYFSAYITALLIHGVEGSPARPENLFIHLVRNISGFFNQERVNVVPPETPPSFLLASATSVATLALVLMIAFRRSPDKLSVKPVFLKSLIITLALMVVITVASFSLPTLASLVLLTTVATLAVMMALTMRGTHA